MSCSTTPPVRGRSIPPRGPAVALDGSGRLPFPDQLDQLLAGRPVRRVVRAGVDAGDLLALLVDDVPAEVAGDRPDHRLLPDPEPGADPGQELATRQPDPGREAGAGLE